MGLTKKLGLIFSIIMTVFNVIVLVTIKFNDLKHLTADVIEIKRDVRGMGIELNELGQRVAKIEGKLEK